MNFREIPAAIETLISGLPDLFSRADIHYNFFGGAPGIGDWRDEKNLGILIAGDGVGSKSGIYFFGSPEGQIVYIGKATKGNLHNRVWDHCKTPDLMPDGRRIFPRHGFGHMDAPIEAEYIRDGRARLGVITVSDSELVSLMEVFLQTLYVKRHGILPALNKQIG